MKCSPSTAQAQQNAYKKGTIIVNEKKTIDAYIQIDFRFPQRFQSSITYISPEAYEKLKQGGKLKGKAKKKPYTITNSIELPLKNTKKLFRKR